MTRLRVPTVSLDLVAGTMQAIFLFAGVLSIIGLLALRLALTMRAFTVIWFFGYLFLVTTVMRSQARENPEQKQRVVLNWAVAVGVGLTLSTLFISFIV